MAAVPLLGCRNPGRAGSTAIPLLRLYLRPWYGGHADFISQGDHMGTVDLTFPFASTGKRGIAPFGYG